MAERLRFLALLSNVGDSVLGAHLMAEVRIEKWPIRKLLRFLDAFGWVPDIDVAYFLAEHYYCLDDSGDHGYVITGEFVPPKATQDENRRKVERQAQEEFVSRLEGRVKLMRLFEDGAIEIPAWFFYRFRDRVPEPDYSSWHSRALKYRPYRVVWSIDELNVFLEKWELPIPLPYLQLAFESFDESYEAHNSKTEFLTLMIAVEILFNMGPQELRYRVARGTAVVLGETVKEAEKIFGRMKKLYDKRSKLVHTGRSEITENDVWWLREYVRRAIVVLGELDIPKEELAPKLDAAGFGQRARYLGYHSRQA